MPIFRLDLDMRKKRQDWLICGEIIRVLRPLITLADADCSGLSLRIGRFEGVIRGNAPLLDFAGA
jgi:hypothetical protein